MRLKIIGGNAIILAVVGLAAYFGVKSQLQEELVRHVDARIQQDAELLERSLRFSASEFQADVLGQAADAYVRTAFLSGVGEVSRRTRAFNAAQAVAAWFANPARGWGGKPDIVALSDETGSVVARDLDPNRMFGTKLVKSLPALAKVLALGVSGEDVWEHQGKLLRVAMAPIRDDSGGVVGALVVGYDLSNGFAKQQADLLGRGVLFLTQERVYSASTGPSLRAELGKVLLADDAPGTANAWQGGRSLPWNTNIDGHYYVGVVGAFPGAQSKKLAFAVVADRTEAQAPASLANWILLATFLGVLAVLIYGSVIAMALLRPIEQIEEGIFAVINGRADQRIDIESQELGGLAYRVNQLINLFTGVSEEDEEGRTIEHSGNWSLNAAAPSAQPAAPSMSPSDLASEPEEDYYRRLFHEYVQAKQRVGEDVSNISFERFSQRLRGNSEHLMKKHGSRMVRFEVQVEGTQVNLKPVIID